MLPILKKAGLSNLEQYLDFIAVLFFLLLVVAMLGLRSASSS